MVQKNYSGDLKQILEVDAHDQSKVIQIGQFKANRAVLVIGHPKGGVVNTALAEKIQFPKARPVPVRLGPSAFPLLLDRREEVTVARNALPYDQTVDFYGSDGIGKTTLLRYLAHHPSITPAFPDGIVYHHSVRYQTVSDLLQILFNAFYFNNTPFKPTDIQIRDALKDKKALILLDNTKLTQEEVLGLINDLPSCTFLFASVERQLWGEGYPVELRGLPLNEAVFLVERELGHTLSSEEHSAAEEICNALEGHPLAILQTVALTREENMKLVAVAKQVQSAASTQGWAEHLLEKLKKPQTVIVVMLAAFGGVALGLEQLASLTKIPEIKLTLETLLRRNLVQVEDSRYRLTGTLVEHLQQKYNLTHFLERAVTYFTNWVKEYQEIPKRLLEESDAILEIMDWAVKVGRWEDVLCLGRAVEGVLALNGQWGTWELVLQKILQAAHTIGDTATEAFALHQLGTRSLCLDKMLEARNYLQQALHMRQELLKDQVGAEITNHNLQLLLEAPPPESKPKPPPKAAFLASTIISPWFKKTLATLVLAGGLGFITKLILEPKPPTEPTELTAKIISPLNPREVVLNWKDNSSNETGFKVERKADGEKFSAIDRVDANQTEFQDTGLTPNTTYIYRVGAIWSSGNVSYSQEKSIFLPSVGDPISLTITILDTITEDESVEGTVTLSTSAPSGGVVVQLRSSDNQVASVPERVKIPAGENSANFTVTTSDVANNTDVTITASYQDKAQKRTLKVIPKPVTLTRLGLPNRITGNKSARATVTLSDRAPSDGVVIRLRSSNNRVASVPERVKIPGGNNSANFWIKTYGVKNNTPVTITAFYQDKTQKRTLTVIPKPVTLTGLDLPNGITGNESARGTVTLSSSAPSGGVVVQLSSNSRVVTVPPTVRVEAGRESKTFEINTRGVSNSTPVTITASYQGVERENLLTVIPPQPVPVSLILRPERIKGGRSTRGRVILSRPVPRGRVVVVRLRSNNSRVASVPQTVTVKAEKNIAYFRIRTRPVRQNTPVTITASHQNVILRDTLTVIARVRLTGLIVTEGRGKVILSGPAPSGGVVIKLRSNNSRLASVPQTVTVKAKKNIAYFRIRTRPVRQNTPVTITASHQNVILRDTLTVIARVRLTGLIVTEGRGKVILSGPAPSGGVVVKLRSNNSQLASVPQTVTVKAKKNIAYFRVKTSNVTQDTLVTINAYYSGVNIAKTLTIEPFIPE